MNIVFVNLDEKSSPGFTPVWRGISIYNALKRTGLHNVSLLSSCDFESNNEISKNVCHCAQLILIEGSPAIDLLTTINYWKSHDKKVVVDIPLCIENNSALLQQSLEKSSSISQIYTNFHNKNISKTNQFERFRWGIHLADCILVSTPQQKIKWQVTAPVTVFPEFIDLDQIRDLAKYKHDSFVIGLFRDQPVDDQLLNNVICFIQREFPRVKWLALDSQNLPTICLSSNRLSKMPQGLSSNWPAPLSLTNLVIFWENQEKKGAFSRYILESMATRIPWILNNQKGYRDIKKYGLIIDEHLHWETVLKDYISSIHDANLDIEDGYVYSISQNLDDHIYEIMSVFSKLIKNTP